MLLNIVDSVDSPATSEASLSVSPLRETIARAETHTGTQSLHIPLGVMCLHGAGSLLACGGRERSSRGVVRSLATTASPERASARNIIPHSLSRALSRALSLSLPPLLNMSVQYIYLPICILRHCSVELCSVLVAST